MPREDESPPRSRGRSRSTNRARKGKNGSSRGRSAREVEMQGVDERRGRRSKGGRRAQLHKTCKCTQAPRSAPGTSRSRMPRMLALRSKRTAQQHNSSTAHLPTCFAIDTCHLCNHCTQSVCPQKTIQRRKTCTNVQLQYSALGICPFRMLCRQYYC